MDCRLNYTDFRCVHCGFPIKSLYVQYSPGNIRLMKCENCKKVADEYIECENMILVIDLLLHKEKVYRHLFYNMFTRETLNFEGLFWWLSFGFLLLDACIFCYEFALLKLQYYSVAVPFGSICTSSFFNEWVWWLNLGGLTTRFGKKRKKTEKTKEMNGAEDRNSIIIKFLT